MTLDILAKILLAYLLGSLVGSLVLGPLFGVDVRGSGSGNAGATNALRASGRGFALGVLLIDIGKGALAAALIPLIPWPVAEGTSAPPGLVPALAGAACVIGHVYPLYFNFQGGKGAATLIGVIAVLAPAALVPMLAVWLLGIVLSGYVGSSTVAAAFTFPLYLALARPETLLTPLGGVSLVMALFILYTHRSNIVRVFQGQEHRFERAMLLRRLRR